MKITLDQLMFALTSIAFLELLWGMSALGYYRLMGWVPRAIIVIVLFATMMSLAGLWLSYQYNLEALGFLTAALATLIIGLTRIDLREWDQYEQASRQAAK